MKSSIIKKPVVSEKSFSLAAEKDKGEKGNAKRQYTFEVDPSANKIEIKNAVEKMYGVKVEGVRTVNVKGKRVRWGKYRQFGKRSSWKKAIVTLSEGEIDIFKVS